jgi:Protein of unknown function (DUF3168)
MSDPSLELQAAIIDRLKDDAGVQAVVGQRVYAVPPTTPTFPYISLADNQVLPDKADCIDGTEIFWQIDGWSRNENSSTGPTHKRISKAVVAALDDLPLTVTSYNNIICELNTINYLRDPDGLTMHVAINFRFLIQAS